MENNIKGLYLKYHNKFIDGNNILNYDIIPEEPDVVPPCGLKECSNAQCGQPMCGYGQCPAAECGNFLCVNNNCTGCNNNNCSGCLSNNYPTYTGDVNLSNIVVTTMSINLTYFISGNINKVYIDWFFKESGKLINSMPICGLTPGEYFYDITKLSANTNYKIIIQGFYNDIKIGYPKEINVTTASPTKPIIKWEWSPQIRNKEMYRYSYDNNTNTIYAYPISADEWRRFCYVINTFRIYKFGEGNETHFTEVYSETDFTASIINEAIDSINQLTGAGIKRVFSGDECCLDLFLRMSDALTVFSNERVG